MKIQWGKSSKQSARDSAVSFNFPVKFTNTPTCISTAQAIDSTTLVVHCLKALDNEHCEVHGYGWSSSTSAGYLGYIAIGY